MNAPCKGGILLREGVQLLHSGQPEQPQKS